MNTETQQAKTKRQIQGNVVSSSSDKTITVMVERKVMHPLYKKYIRRSTKLHVHDENNDCNTGDKVRIEACTYVQDQVLAPGRDRLQGGLGYLAEEIRHDSNAVHDDGCR